MDPRHQKRIKIVQNLFALSFNKPQNNVSQELNEISTNISKNLTLIDSLISKHAPKFPIDKIAKLDLAILRLSIYELIIDRKEPPKVIIDEAVEIAKEFGSDKSYGFINAILGKIYQNEKKS